jgi:hypothetical protein
MLPDGLIVVCRRYRMSRFTRAALAIVAAVLVAPSAALAAWTTPVTVDARSESNPVAQGAFGGSVLTGWFERSVSLARRDGDAFGPLAPLSAADPFERAWDFDLAENGDAVVLTVRKHAPIQRIRARFVPASGPARGPVTISDRAHAATRPVLDVGPDGTTVAAWLWHARPSWLVQAAIRRPGQARFDRPQTLSVPAPAVGGLQPRPWVHVAAGTDGRAVLTWQIGGDAALPERPLHVRTAGTDGVFGPDQELGDAGGLADVGLALDLSGAVQVAYLDEHFAGHEAPTRLHVAQGVVGAPLSAPAVLASGGQGTSSGSQIGAAFSADGSATVAWARPGDRYEAGGTLEAFTRPPGGAFGRPQMIATGASGITLAAGPGASAVIGWMREAQGRHAFPLWSVQAAIRPPAGGTFGPDETISATDRNALWPSMAMTPAGDAIAAWITNRDGSGAGQVAAALDPAG